MKKSCFKIFTALLLVFLISTVFPGCKKNSSSAAPESSKPAAASSYVTPSSSAAADSSSQPSSAPASSAQSSKSSDNTSITKTTEPYIVFTIDATKGNDGVVADNVKMDLKSSDTAYTVLKRYCDQKKISLRAQITAGKVFVTAIDGVQMLKSNDGWLYKVNGKYPTVDSNKNPLKSGDKVVWEFTNSFVSIGGE